MAQKQVNGKAIKPKKYPKFKKGTRFTLPGVKVYKGLTFSVKRKFYNSTSKGEFKKRIVTNTNVQNPLYNKIGFSEVYLRGRAKVI